MQVYIAVAPEIVAERYPFSRTKGPALLGAGAPVHVLQSGDDVREIVNIAALTLIDTASRKC